MKRRVFIGLGAASIGAGTLHSTGALSSLSASRGVAVSAADNLSALLGIDTEDELIEVSDEEVRVAELTNNTSRELVVSSLYVVSIGDGTVDDDLVEVAEPIQGDPIATDGTEVTVRCNSDEDAGEQPVTIQAAVDGPSVSIDEVTFDVTLDIQCDTGGGNTASGFQFVSAGDVADGGTQVFSFQGDGDLKTNDTVIIDLSLIDGVDYSDANVELTENNQPNDEVEFLDSETIQVSFQGNAQETIFELEVTGYEVTGDSGEEYTVQFERSDADQRAADSFQIV